MKFSLVLLAGATTVLADAVHQPVKRAHHAAINNRVRRQDTEALEKRDTYSGTATWYDVTTGQGACGTWLSPSDFTVALNSPQLDAYGGYQNGKPSTCGDSITISYNGETQVATIMDECPSCAWGSLDMSEGLFQSFAGLDQGVFQMSWWFNDGSNGGGSGNQDTPTPQQPAWTPDPTTSTPAWTPDPTTSTPAWTPPATTSTTEAPPPPATTYPPSSQDTPSTTTTTTQPPANVKNMQAAVVQLAGLINAAVAV